MSKHKRDLTLLPGNLALDAESIAQFFTKLTGKTPSDEEMEELRRYLAGQTPPRSSDADDVTSTPQ